VVTVAAPADTEHVVASFHADLAAIERDGKAEVQLAGRRFTITKQFLDDVRHQDLTTKISDLRRPLLVFHSPTDEVVGIENARQIYDAARHPKSFVSLDRADHLLTKRDDAAFVAEVVSAWYARYIPSQLDDHDELVAEGALVRATGLGRFQQVVRVGPHRLTADEPVSSGGLGSGPSPYDFLSVALGTCTAMTFQLYAERKGWQLPPFTVEVRHDRIHAEDCAICVEGGTGLVDYFARRIAFASDPGDPIREKALEIAGKCPVHRTLENRSAIETSVHIAKASPVERTI
jgi:putative redox protein